jgi:hypothetical protein
MHLIRLRQIKMLIRQNVWGGLRFCACPAIARSTKGDGGSAHALLLDVIYYF